ncbi:MAG TPA: YicC/YloC family endoribonuclease [Bryobacteraceae bacterium]|nr:YicC/YloC family endoribonuclease [Bryobacteraceae bacterium]
MSAPIRSMTGFARVQRSTPQGEISISLKSVNHKGLDPHFHLETDLDALESVLRTTLKKAVLRGHVDIRCSLVRSGDAAAGGLNAPLLHAAVAAFRKLAREEGLDNAQPDLNQLMRLPGMFGAGAEPAPDPSLERPLLAAFEEALEVLNQFRSREGAELAALIRDHNHAIAAGAAELADIRSRATPAFQSRLAERLNELLGNSTLDPQRIAQEAALLADRSDIGEEISRLQIHSRQLDEILDAGGEVGKKLDFLLQEMNRETNTVLSKTSGIGDLGLRITDLALASKAAIEKIREQALNLE